MPVSVLLEIHRAQSPQQAAKRIRFLDIVFAAIQSEPFTREIGLIAQDAIHHL